MDRIHFIIAGKLDAMCLTLEKRNIAMKQLNFSQAHRRAVSFH